ncbi:MAG: redoxin domain-containing protein [Alistipes sp.]|nr:redoxin domain-containing protein [Alistipes sp.]
MNGCLNILWHFPFFGFLFALFYALFGAILCCTVVLYPVGLGFFQIAQFLLSPFSSALVTRKELDLVRPEERSTAAMAYSTIITILYFPFGLIAAAGALFAMIGEFLSIIGIPCGIVWFKALPAIFMPVDKVCVPKAVADEIERIKAGDTVRRYKGETGETDSDPSERHFTEDPDDSFPPMPEVRQYDDEKLHEIVSGAAMYRASLVDDCRRELEIRRKSTEFTAQVRAMDNDKLHEVLSSPQLYAEELYYACTLEQNERRRVWREEEAKQEELRRLRQEQEEKEAAERRAAAWKKWRPYVFATVAVLILVGVGAGYYSYHKKQEQLHMERISEKVHHIAKERNIGTIAPDFTVKMLNNDSKSLASIRGNTILLTFCKTTCPPSRQFLEQINKKIINHFATSNLTFLPIFCGESRETVQKFLKETGYTFPIGLDPQEKIFSQYNVRYTPQNFIISKGRIIWSSFGYEESEFKEIINIIGKNVKYSHFNN